MNFPKEVRIENTNMCNFHCIMCPREKLTRKKGIMAYELFKKIINECIKYNVKTVHVHGYGEPLLDKEICKKIKYAKKSGIPFVVMITNGSLLTKSLSQQIINSGLDKIFISHYAIKENTFDTIHRGFNFKKTQKRILSFLLYLKNMKKKTPTVTMSFLEQPFNINEKEEWINYWSNYCAKLDITKLHNYGNKKDYLPIKKNINRETCGRILKTMNILWDGTIVPCCFDMNGEIKLGNVNKQSLVGILNGTLYKQLVEDHKNKLFDKYPLCDNCEQLDPIFKR